MVNFDSILYILPAMSMAIALVYYTMNLRNAQKTQRHAQETREAQLFMQIFNQYTNQQVMELSIEIMAQWKWETYEEFYEKYGPVSKPVEYAKFLKLVNFFEGIGILQKRGLIDINLVNDLMGDPLIWVWEKISPVIDGLREQTQSPNLWVHCGYIAEELKKHRLSV
jgi:hypothetical protein